MAPVSTTTVTGIATMVTGIVTMVTGIAAMVTGIATMVTGIDNDGRGNHNDGHGNSNDGDKMYDNNDKNMKRIVFLTGAGMSAESGFKTFRGNDGLWENYPVEQVATHEGLERDPSLVINFFNMLRRKLFDAQPNKGHRLIHDLENSYEVSVITQNIDNLHERAGSTDIIHLHGELSKVCSSADPYNPAYIRELSPEEAVIKPGTLAADGSLLRPFIVLFGESVPMMEAAIAKVRQADIMVVVGSSLNVYPAAGLVLDAPATCPIYLIDPAPVTISRDRVTHIMCGAGEGMEKLTEMLRDGQTSCKA